MARIVVSGYLGLLPAGGVTWDYLQYPLGLHRLGHDVLYLEDTRLWPVYQTDDAGGADCSANVAHLASVMDAFGMADRWAYRDEASGRWYGRSERKALAFCDRADALVNVSCSLAPRREYSRIPRRLLIDSDPMFTQIQYRTQSMFTPGESGIRELVDAHTHHFTFGLDVGSEGCRIPDCGLDWRPTRQPICLSEWPYHEPVTEPGAAFTTVMNWSAAPPLDYEGESWGQKNVEFLKLMDLPRRVAPQPLAVAVGQTTGAPFPADEARRHGWRVLDPRLEVPSWREYRDFIVASRGELSVAKETYVKARSGWFSCRSACYLAAGRPVVTQETGWSRHLPHGEGLFAFSTVEEAVAALAEAAADPERQSRAARRIAAEHFDSRRVLTRLLEEAW